MIGGAFIGGAVTTAEVALSTVWLRIGNVTTDLPRLRFGNSKTIRSRSADQDDLMVNQTTWPRTSAVHCEFGALQKHGETFTTQQIKRFRELTTQMPGWPAVLIFPDGTELTGFISNIMYEEIDMCRASVAFDFDVFANWYATGEMVIS